MAKFNVSTGPKVPSSFVQSTGEATINHQGGVGRLRDEKSELFISAVSNLVEDKYYESSYDNVARIVSLTQKVAKNDPTWLASFICWLRDEARLRTVAMVIAVAAALHPSQSGTGQRKLFVDVAIRRADEPGEVLAITKALGAKPNQAIKRGVASAVQRLYTEKSWLKYRGKGGDYSMADVIRVTHPKPYNDAQSELFRAIMTHEKGNDVDASNLPIVAARFALNGLSPENFEQKMKGEGGAKFLRDAGLTWQALSGYLKRPLNDSEWEALIPEMGYQALLMNLRNIYDAGVSGDVMSRINERLQDEEEVKSIGLLPYAYLSAFKYAPEFFHHSIQQAAEYSIQKIEALPGKSLILVDMSGSMFFNLSKFGATQAWEMAGLFGTALNRVCEESDLYQYGTDVEKVHDDPRRFVLSSVRSNFHSMGGTATTRAINSTYANHDRVILVTDEQNHFSSQGIDIPDNVPLYVWNLMGYQAGSNFGHRNIHTFGGLNDSSFGVVPLIEAGTDANWPF